MSTNQEAQSDELLALASIFDDEEFRRTESSQKGEIHLCLELPPDFRLLINGESLCKSWFIEQLSRVLELQLESLFVCYELCCT